MPRFDGTGPTGRGPMTGGARGPCNPANRTAGSYRTPYPSNAQPPAYGASRPRWGLRGFFRGRGGRGRGGRGRGRGFGR